MTVRTCATGGLLFFLSAAGILCAQQPYTLQQVLSAPYASELTAAPTGDRFAWVENAEGHHNLWLGSPHTAAHQLTIFDEDDGLDLYSLAWSPDSSVVAFTRSTEDGPDGKPSNPAHLQRKIEPQIWLAPVAGPVPTAPTVQGTHPLFSHDGHALYFVREGQIWSLQISPVPAQPAQLVFDRGRASSLTLSPDGRLLAFISTRGSGQREHSYLALFDMRTRALTFPAASTDDDSAPAFSLDGKQLAWLRTPFVSAPEFAATRVSANPWSIQLLDVGSGKARAAFTPAPNVPGSVIAHMSQGEPRLFWTAQGQIIFPSEADGWVHLYELDPAHADRAPQLLTEGEFEVGDPAISADGTTLVYASNQAVNDPLDTDRRHIWRMDIENGPSAIEITHGAGIETHPQLSAETHSLVALISNAREPMHAAFITSRGEMQPLHLNALPPDYPAQQLSAPQQVLFSSNDKLFTLHGQVFYPPHFNGMGSHPAILFFHGGPHRQMLLGYPGMDYYSNAYAMNEYLASRGFIVLSVNYRCGIGYGMNFRDCENSGAAGAAEYNDVLGAVNYLRGSSYVDQTRIGVWGGSYGGYLTAMALGRNSDLFAAGVDFSGVHEWAREDNAGDWLRGTLAEQERIATVAHASSPMAAVDRWKSPVLFVHGDDDPDVAYQQTPRLADALRARGVAVDEVIFPDEVHDFILHRDWLSSYERSATFFEHVLHPER